MKSVGKFYQILFTCRNHTLKWNALILYLLPLYQQFPGLLHDSFLCLFFKLSQSTHFSLRMAYLSVPRSQLSGELLCHSFAHNIVAKSLNLLDALSFWKNLMQYLYSKCLVISHGNKNLMSIQRHLYSRLNKQELS